MIKVAKSESRYDKMLQEIEDVLRKHEAQMIVENHGLVFSFGGKDGVRFRLQYTESGEPSSGLPRELEDEKLVLEED